MNYPARTRKNSSVENAKEVFEQSRNVRSKVEVQVENSKFADANENKNLDLWVAGRIVGILEDGFVLQDESGRMDVVFGSMVNVGDIIEIKVHAEIRIDKFGREIKVFAGEDMQVLAQCSSDFFVQRKDPNYKKIIIDLQLKNFLDQRIRLTRMLREFFWSEGFVETETPTVVKLPGMEPYLDVFKTKFFSLPFEGRPKQEEDLYLITSPEYALKKLLVAGYEKVFQVTKCFRNKETESSLHNPEFTMIEWYRSYASYEEIMNDAEKLIETLALAANDDRAELKGKKVIRYQGHTIDVSRPWRRLTVQQAFEEYAGIAQEVFEDEQQFKDAARAKGYKLMEDAPYEEAFFLIFMNEIEPKLGFDKPVVLHDYPTSMAALSKKKSGNEKYAERFEIYIAGVELCNGFTELNDPVEQKHRLEAERLERQKLGKDDYPVDQSFISALEFGMPPSGGVALGIDRLMMILTDCPDIRDIVFFPHRDL